MTTPRCPLSTLVLLYFCFTLIHYQNSTFKITTVLWILVVKTGTLVIKSTLVLSQAIVIRRLVISH